VQPATYEFRVRGHLDAAAVAELPGLAVREHGDETVLTGVVVDQAALHGVIERLEQMGAHLVEVRQRPAETDPGRDPHRAEDPVR
jgi:hypothetical protein